MVLARAIDDSTFNVLNSCILFNQIDIINHVQNDQMFLREVVGIFLDEEMLKNLVSKGKEPERPKPEGEKMDVDQPSDASHQNGSLKRRMSEAELKRRKEVLLLIQQLCVMGKNVQLPARMALFRTLCDRGILFSVQWGLGQPDSDPEGLQMISAAGEILTTLLDHDLNGVRNHVLKQLGPIDDKNPTRKIEHDTVLSVMCRVLVRSRDLAVQSQIFESTRAMMEIPQDNGMDHVCATRSHKILTNRGISRWVPKSSSDRRTIRGRSASWTTSISIALTCYFTRCSISRTSRMSPVRCFVDLGSEIILTANLRRESDSLS